VKKGKQSSKEEPVKDGEIKQLSGLQMPAIAERVSECEYLNIPGPRTQIHPRTHTYGGHRQLVQTTLTRLK